MLRGIGDQRFLIQILAMAIVVKFFPLEETFTTLTLSANSMQIHPFCGEFNETFFKIFSRPPILDVGNERFKIIDKTSTLVDQTKQ